MVPLTTDGLRAALRAVQDPASGRDIVSAGLVDSLAARDGLVHLALRTDRAGAAAMEGVRRAAEAEGKPGDDPRSGPRSIPGPGAAAS